MDVTITIERGGEMVRTTVPEGATVKALTEGGHLRGIDTSVLVNGRPATENTPVRDRDEVTEVPKSGQLG